MVAQVPVAIALGSNLGDRERCLRDALTALAGPMADLRHSTFYETDPVGLPAEALRAKAGVGPQPRFLNAAAIGQTTLSPRALLAALLETERQFHRTRPYPGAPRTLDLDLILYGDTVIDDPDLLVPHPRFRERRFVLAPLAEIAADWIDPVTGRTVGELLRDLQGPT
ncbi:MAG: 2-amino-4-hydroxy-6-hydroxymethyldihydropteridine diphosphokinase [Acidobacteria bacterium]|nr:2-amino-4-hydroxy-6-hydroxymethyldihydropteridine diphosphokinase [Acidobacteriota bacterium]